ncbi:hypothetical protein ACJX0J_016308, partial [Zea mays]
LFYSNFKVRTFLQYSNFEFMQQDDEDRKNKVIVKGLEDKIKKLEDSLKEKDELLSAKDLFTFILLPEFFPYQIPHYPNFFCVRNHLRVEVLAFPVNAFCDNKVCGIISKTKLDGFDWDQFLCTFGPKASKSKQLLHWKIFNPNHGAKGAPELALGLNKNP